MKIGIVGCGNIAGAHLLAISKSEPQAEVYLCDVNLDMAKKFEKNKNVVAIYSNLDEMLNKEDLKTLHVLTPNSTHYRLAKKGLEADCHVLLEKPATNTADELRELYAISKERNRVFCVDHNFLGMPVIMDVKSKIKSGYFGKLIAAHCHFGASGGLNNIPYNDPYHWSYRSFGGVLANWACHPASVLFDFLEPIQEVDYQLIRRNILPNNCPDLLHVTVNNRDQIGSFTLSMGHGNSERHIVLLFEKGTIFIDITRQLYSCIKGNGPQNFINKALSGIIFGLAPIKGTFENLINILRGTLTRDPGIVNVSKSFYGAIRSGEELMVSEANAVAVTELLENIWTSSDKNNVSS